LQHSVAYDTLNSELISTDKKRKIVAYATKTIYMTQKSYPKIDFRVKRTEKLIFDALIRCTIKKGFSAVTVSDITLEAEINRATFYRHYKDKEDVLNQYTQTVFNMLHSQNTIVNNSQSHTLPDSLVKIFDHVGEHALFYKVMLGRNGNPNFAEKIRSYIQKRIRNSLPNSLKVDEKRLDLFITYSAHASFGIVLWWLEHDMPYSSEEMIQMLQHLESENLKTILK